MNPEWAGLLPVSADTSRLPARECSCVFLKASDFCACGWIHRSLGMLPLWPVPSHNAPWQPQSKFKVHRGHQKVEWGSRMLGTFCGTGLHLTSKLASLHGCWFHHLYFIIHTTQSLWIEKPSGRFSDGLRTALIFFFFFKSQTILKHLGADYYSLTLWSGNSRTVCLSPYWSGGGWCVCLCMCVHICVDCGCHYRGSVHLPFWDKASHWPETHWVG